MPMPLEYLHAGEAYESFINDAREALNLTTRNQTYTTVQAVLLVFRRRLTVEQGLRFADLLPAVLRAIFVADWDTAAPPAAFTSREALTEEVRSLRKAHNFSPDTAIHDVASTLRNHIQADQLDDLLATFPDGAAEYWNTKSKV